MRNTKVHWSTQSWHTVNPFRRNLKYRIYVLFLLQSTLFLRRLIIPLIFYLLKFYYFFRLTFNVYLNFQVSPLRRSLRREISESRIVLSLRTDWMARVTSVFVRWFSLKKIRIEIKLQIQGLKLRKIWKTRRKIVNKFCSK